MSLLDTPWAFHSTLLSEARLPVHRDGKDKSMGTEMKGLGRGITRRSFLKTTAVFGGATVLGSYLSGCGSIASQEPQEGAEEQVFTSFCYACQGCPLDVTVRNDNVVRIKAKEIPGNELFGIPEGDDLKRICARGASIPYQIVSEKRIQYPMKRVGERGEGKWERITWDEAIATICEKINSYQSEFGKNSICMFSYGSVEARYMYATNRLQNVAQFSNQHRATDNAYAQGAMNTVGSFFFMLGNNQAAIRGLRTIVVWGHNPCEAWPNTWHYIADAIESNGAKLIVIDPNYNTTASKSDLFISVRHGSDGALALGIINYLEENGLTQDAYMQSKSNAAFLVKSDDGMFLRRSDLEEGIDPTDPTADDYAVWDDTTDSLSYSQVATDPALRKGEFQVSGKKVSTAYDLLIDLARQYPLDKAAEITGVPQEAIVELATLISTGEATEILQGYGLDHYGNGYNTVTAVCALRIVCGMVGDPAILYPLNESGFASDELEHPVMGDNLSTFMFNDLLDTGKCEIPGKTVEVPLKALLSFGGNLINSCPNRNESIEAYKKFEFIAHASIEWGDTADIADIVLPVSMPQESIGTSYVDECLIFMEQAITPRWEAKSDFEICSLIAEGIGLGDWFDFDMDYAMSKTLDNQVFPLMGITYEALKAAKIIRLGLMPLPAYMTATGRLQVYIEQLSPMVGGVPISYFGQTLDMKNYHLPLWEPPLEAWPETVSGFEANPLAEKYPLRFHAGPRRFRVHSYYGWEKMLRELEYDEPIVRMNPLDADARGIGEGDYVRCFNDRGHAVAKAVFHPGIRPGGVDIDRGWQAAQYISGCSQDLTTKEITNWVCPNYSYHDCLCEIEKWHG
jgi:molybdopterin-containing oxidoreductase family molybdopterin binding subunit